LRRNIKGPKVDRQLLPGQSQALLRELHLLTRDGDLNADSLRKLKQVNHLVGLLRPAIEDVMSRFGDPVIVDCGAGKSYLGFVLYELFLKDADKGRLLAIESRPDLCAAAAERAKRLGFSRMQFVQKPVEDVGDAVPARVNLVTALHACDTATDDALALGIGCNADHVAVVPCCQAEVARQLEHGELEVLYEHAIHRREFAAHLTNVIRALTLEARGYKVTVTELVGWEHSLKNELILGKKTRARSEEAQRKLDALLQKTGARPRIVSALAQSAAAIDRG
jgi:hypothetical protein